MLTIEEVLTRLAQQSLTVNNLFQLPPTYTTWRANISDATHNSQFGNAATPAEALLAALTNWNEGNKVEKRVPGPLLAPELYHPLPKARSKRITLDDL